MINALNLLWIIPLACTFGFLVCGFFKGGNDDR